MAGLGRIDVGKSRTSLVLETMKQKDKGRQRWKSTDNGVWRWFGEASDDVMKTHLPMGQKEMENCHPATGDASFIANGTRLQSCLGRFRSWLPFSGRSGLSNVIRVKWLGGSRV